MIYWKTLRPKSSLLLLLALFTYASSLVAQKINLGAGAGAMNYKGDLAPKFDPRFFRPGVNIFFRYNLSPSVSLRLSGTAGSITANDQKSSDPFAIIRNDSFKTMLNEGAIISEYNFLNYGTKRRIINWTPYVFGGIGRYHFEPTVRSGVYKLNDWSIPFGIGLKYEFARPWSLEFEYGTRKLFTDNLDNFGDNINNSTQKYRQGDPYRNDMFYYFSVSLSYTFYRIWCPDKDAYAY